MVKPKESKYKSELLDPNHSHFLLIDDSTVTYGGEVDFRTKLEKEIAEKKSTLSSVVQIVVLVVGGGPRTIKLVYESVKNGIPCVFLESSGESADIFAYALSKNDENEKNKTKEQKEKTNIGEV
jgi:transient receptor potential cation channel subfamily M protein 2